MNILALKKRAKALYLANRPKKEVAEAMNFVANEQGFERWADLMLHVSEAEGAPEPQKRWMPSSSARSEWTDPDAEKARAEPGALPPFVSVERMLASASDKPVPSITLGDKLDAPVDTELQRHPKFRNPYGLISRQGAMSQAMQRAFEQSEQQQQQQQQQPPKPPAPKVTIKPARPNYFGGAGTSALAPKEPQGPVNPFTGEPAGVGNTFRRKPTRTDAAIETFGAERVFRLAYKHLYDSHSLIGVGLSPIAIGDVWNVMQTAWHSMEPGIRKIDVVNAAAWFDRA